MIRKTAKPNPFIWSPAHGPRRFITRVAILTLAAVVSINCIAQETSQKEGDSSTKTRQQEIQLGSKTAKGGFENEDEIRDKFNNWRVDEDARAWLKEMNYDLANILNVKAKKPHGEKADVEVTIKTRSQERVEGISIKLVSSPNGFNQIDKRWLKTYAKMWDMPEDVHEALKLFVGEKSPDKAGRDARRQYLNELPAKQQRAVLDFFEAKRQQIVSDLFAGDGEHAAGWIMVTLKLESELDTSKARESTKLPNKEVRWALCQSEKVASFFGDGPVQITAAGNLKIGRITMQRKGGDNGRESANMLQFKINPVELFSLQTKPAGR